MYSFWTILKVADTGLYVTAKMCKLSTSVPMKQKILFRTATIITTSYAGARQWIPRNHALIVHEDPPIDRWFYMRKKGEK